MPVLEGPFLGGSGEVLGEEVDGTHEVLLASGAVQSQSVAVGVLHRRPVAVVEPDGLHNRPRVPAVYKHTNIDIQIQIQICDQCAILEAPTEMRGTPD